VLPAPAILLSRDLSISGPSVMQFSKEGGGNGKLWACWSAQHRLAAFDCAIAQDGKASPTGRHHCTIGAVGATTSPTSSGGFDDPCELQRPSGFLVLAGVLYVCDSGNHRIAMFCSVTGTFLRSFGGPGEAPGRMRSPRHICFVRDHLVVAEGLGCNRLQAFNLQGQPRSLCRPAAPYRLDAENPPEAETSFPKISSVCATPSGEVLIADRGHILFLDH